MRLEKYLKLFASYYCLFSLPLYFCGRILEENFYVNGEAYFKGEGHLLSENLKLGLLTPIIFQVFWTAIIFYLISP